MSAVLTANWWAVALRGLAAITFAAVILLMPQPTLAALILLFAAYLTADGLLAILVGARAARRGARWRMLILEGAINLGLAGVVLVWPAISAVPFLHLVGAWAIITGALLLAAARRLSGPHGGWALALAGATSAAWGAAANTAAWYFGGELPGTTAWLAAYAILFGATILVLAHRLRGARSARVSRHRPRGRRAWRAAPRRVSK
jgi:uncharacterized membrane protein HdeD (DUF308 family)